MVLFGIIYVGHTPLASWKSRGFSEIYGRMEGVGEFNVIGRYWW